MFSDSLAKDAQEWAFGWLGHEDSLSVCGGRGRELRSSYRSTAAAGGVGPFDDGFDADQALAKRLVLPAQLAQLGAEVLHLVGDAYYGAQGIPNFLHGAHRAAFADADGEAARPR